MSKSYPDLRSEAISALTDYMDSLDEKKASVLAYWVRDYVSMLQKEPTFDPKKLIRYKRGAIVKVHLGYRIGSEEGGLHYAIVMDSHNALSSPTLTVIPLTSVKPNTDLSKLHFSKLSLGKEVYQLITIKAMAEVQLLRKKAQELRNLQDSDAGGAKSASLEDEIKAIESQYIFCQKIIKEIEKMKKGSIALVGQITTVSKIRIYDPLYRNDALSNLYVSDDTLDRLDQKVLELFGHA